MNLSKDYCPKCQQPTNHKSLFIVSNKSNYSDDFQWHEDFEIIQCLGCEHIQFRIRYEDEYMYNHSDEGEEEQYEDLKYYPKSLSSHKLLNNIYELPDKIRIVYIETIEALKNNCYILSGVGLRAIIESICINQNIPGKNLETKINNLVRNKLITEKDGNRLHSIRFLGNDSVHEMDVPKEEKLKIALDIAENLLKNLYLIDIDAKKHLDTIISDYEDFRNLLLRKFRSKNIETGSEISVKKVLDKDFRRVERNYLSNFINQLTDDISNNTITTISVGKFENNEQYFIKN